MACPTGAPCCGSISQTGARTSTAGPRTSTPPVAGSPRNVLTGCPSTSSATLVVPLAAVTVQINCSRLSRTVAGSYPPEPSGTPVRSTVAVSPSTRTACTPTPSGHGLV